MPGACLGRGVLMPVLALAMGTGGVSADQQGDCGDGKEEQSLHREWSVGYQATGVGGLLPGAPGNGVLVQANSVQQPPNSASSSLLNTSQVSSGSWPVTARDTVRRSG